MARASSRDTRIARELLRRAQPLLHGELQRDVAAFLDNTKAVNVCPWCRDKSYRSDTGFLLHLMSYDSRHDDSLITELSSLELKQNLFARELPSGHVAKRWLARDELCPWCNTERLTNIRTCLAMGVHVSECAHYQAWLLTR